MREYKTITIHQEVVMGCGCGKKRTGTVHFMGKDSGDAPQPDDWGPILWKYLHCLVEKIGTSGTNHIHNDQILLLDNIIRNLHTVLPCTDCQNHARNYILNNPFPQIKMKPIEEAKHMARIWLFTFHNHVRQMKGQPIIVNTIDQCIETYNGCFVPQCEYTFFIQAVAYAVRQGWVRIDNWKKWYSYSEKIKLITGNIIV